MAQLNPIHFKNWNNQQGIIGTPWKSSDYKNLKFTKREHEYDKEGMGFETEKINFDTYGKNLSVYVGNSFDIPVVFNRVSALFLCHLLQK